MTTQDPILDELKGIRFHLSLLTHEIRSSAMKAFQQEMLRSDERIRAWWAFDGSSKSEDVGKAAGVSGRLVRDMIRDPAVSPLS